MSNKQETTKALKNKETSNKTCKSIEKKNNNKQKNKKFENKEKDESSALKIIKEVNELSPKENEYIGILENLKFKLKNIEQNTENEENKLIIKNSEKEKRLQLLTNSNLKIKKTLNLLTEKIEQIKSKLGKNKNGNSQTQKINKSYTKDKSDEKLEDKDFSKQDQDIKSKQKLINILSNENRSLKKHLDHYYELNTNNKIYVEIRQKDNMKKNLAKEIKIYETIINKHMTECVDKINKLKEELGQIQSNLSEQNLVYHNKSKDYIYLQSKFSLQKKEDEKYYNELKNKQKFLDMNKHPYLMNLNSEKNEAIKIYLNKRNELSREIENGLIAKYEKIVSLPKIDINREGKVVSSIFSEEEMEKIKNLYNDDEEKFQNFVEKVTELERGENENKEGDELLEEYTQLENEVQEKEENIFVEQHNLKKKDNEINSMKQEYRNVLKKNIKLKKEEKNLKENLDKIKYKYSTIIKQQNAHKEINNIIDGINDIVTGSKKNKEKIEEENNNKEKKEENNEGDNIEQKNEENNENNELEEEFEGEEGENQNEEQYEENEDN